MQEAERGVTAQDSSGCDPWNQSRCWAETCQGPGERSGGWGQGHSYEEACV